MFSTCEHSCWSLIRSKSSFVIFYHHFLSYYRLSRRTLKTQLTSLTFFAWTFSDFSRVASLICPLFCISLSSSPIALQSRESESAYERLCNSQPTFLDVSFFGDQSFLYKFSSGLESWLSRILFVSFQVSFALVTISSRIVEIMSPNVYQSSPMLFSSRLIWIFQINKSQNGYRLWKGSGNGRGRKCTWTTRKGWPYIRQQNPTSHFGVINRLPGWTILKCNRHEFHCNLHERRREAAMG